MIPEATPGSEKHVSLLSEPKDGGFPVADQNEMEQSH
jgi:hypothetical protein